MEHIVLIIVTVVGCNGLWALIQSIVTERKREESVEHEALLALLHNSLYKQCEQSIEKEFVTFDEVDNLEYLYRPYKKLGGNGTCERLMDEVRKLPIRSKGGK